MKFDFKALTAPFSDDQIAWKMSDFKQAAKSQDTIIVPYLEAVTVRTRLDDVMGPENWASDIQHMPDGMICRLSLKINNEWVTKSDCAHDTAQFSSMGASTRAFVRAASTWGIGRYLNELPVFYADYVVAGTPGAREIRFGEQIFHHLPPSLNKPTKKQAPAEPPRPKVDIAPTLGYKSQIDAIKPVEDKAPATVSYIPQVVAAKVKGAQAQVQDSAMGVLLPDADKRPFADEKMRSCRTKGKKFKEHTVSELMNLVDFFTKECPYPTKTTTIEDKKRLTEFLGGSLELPKYA